MGTPRPTSLCTSCGWLGHDRIGACDQCGGTDLAAVAAGALVRVPPGYLPCSRCERLDAPLVFRGTVRLASMIVIARETRPAGYFCEECARRQTAASLAYTGLIGWWGIISLFVYAPRGTYYNWRAVWRPPHRPLAWGALDAEAVAADLRARRADSWSVAAEADLERATV